MNTTVLPRHQLPPRKRDVEFGCLAVPQLRLHPCSLCVGKFEADDGLVVSDRLFEGLERPQHLGQIESQVERRV